SIVPKGRSRYFTVIAVLPSGIYNDALLADGLVSIDLQKTKRRPLGRVKAKRRPSGCRGHRQRGRGTDEKTVRGLFASFASRAAENRSEASPSVAENLIRY
ncbi:MAG: hypothetical protein ABWY78_16920, partial [Microvirga sp.]